MLWYSVTKFASLDSRFITDTKYFICLFLMELPPNLIPSGGELSHVLLTDW